MKVTSTIWPLAAIVAGGLILKHKKGTPGVGALTTQQLEDAILSIRFSGYGHFLVTFRYRGEDYSFTTNDTLAVDRIKEHGDIPDNEMSGWYTYRQALQALYDEGKRKNGLGEYR